MNFYQEKLLEIENLIKEKVYFKALNIIQDEFKAPYLPLFFEKKLQFFLEKIQVIFQANKNKLNNDFTASFPLNKVKQIILSPKLGKIHPFIFTNLAHYNIKLFYSTLEKYFKSDQYSLENKTFLLLFLQKQKINHLFILHKNEQIQKINPFLLNQSNVWDLYENTLKLFSNSFLIHESTIKQLAQNLLMQFYCFFYPSIPDFIKAKELSCAVVFQTSKILGKN